MRGLRRSAAWLALCLPLALVVAACGGGEDRPVAEDGDSVAVHYIGTLDDGEVFDSSDGRDPLTFVVGSGAVIAGFDAGVRGMAVGDQKTVHIEPKDAYGEHRDDLVLTVPRSAAPEGLAVGDPVQLANGARAIVTALTADSVTVDANSPLAGKALNFELSLVSIEKP